MRLLRKHQTGVLEKMINNNETNYVIIGTETQIWAINPVNRQRLLLAKNNSKILDLYANNSGIYHASPLFKVKTAKKKASDGHWCNGNVYKACVQVYDSISNNPIITIEPKNTKWFEGEYKAIWNSNIPIFNFRKKDNSLLYLINNSEEGVIFNNINGECAQTEKTRINNNEIYFGNKKIAVWNEPIKHFTETMAMPFERAFRGKNKFRYKKNKSFFSI